MISATLQLAARSARTLLADTGALWRLALASGSCLVRAPFRRGEKVRLRATVVQCLRAGNGSLPLVALILFLVGMIMALQSAYQLRQLGALALVPDLVAVSVTRELAPLLTAIVVAGRFGSAVAAEIGTMQVSQEVDALKVMGIDPVSFLVTPRLAGLVVALPALTVFADLIGILGGYAVGVWLLDLGSGSYVAATREALELQDVYTGLLKALAFAVIIGLVGCQQGLQTRGGPEEVGRATTASVVRSIVLVIAADLFATALFYLRG